MCALVFCCSELLKIFCMTKNTLIVRCYTWWLTSVLSLILEAGIFLAAFPALPTTLYRTPGTSAWRKKRKKKQSSVHFHSKITKAQRSNQWRRSTCWEWATMQSSHLLMRWGARGFLLRLFPPLPSERRRHAPGRCCTREKTETPYLKHLSGRHGATAGEIYMKEIWSDTISLKFNFRFF